MMRRYMQVLDPPPALPLKRLNVLCDPNSEGVAQLAATGDAHGATPDAQHMA